MIAGRRVHLVGIGGAGMSGLARLLLAGGDAVSGCDERMGRVLEQLSDLGVAVCAGHDPAHVATCDVVVASSAISCDHPELAAARTAGVPSLRRAAALAELMRGRIGVAVSGTHGKTTTTAMLARILEAAGADPSFAIGGELDDTGTNARLGGGPHFVVEADESDGSFLDLPRSLVVVTNVEADHLDHYGDVAAIRKAFEGFVAGVPGDGAAVLCADDPGARSLAAAASCAVVTYSAAGAPADLAARDVVSDAHGSRSTLVGWNETGPGEVAELQLRVPGRHNVANALAALAAARRLGVARSPALAALRDFAGVRRRFEVVAEVAGVTIVDDYAIHPTELAAVFAVARSGPWARVVAVFQPHRYSRTAALGPELGRALADGADLVVVTGVYAASEAPLAGVDGRVVADAARAAGGADVRYVADRRALAAAVARLLRPGDLLLTIGAGDVTALGREVEALLAAPGPGSDPGRPDPLARTTDLQVESEVR